MGYYYDAKGRAGSAPPLPPGRPPASAVLPPRAGASAAAWTAQRDPASGRTYYVNATTGQTSWTAPGM